jgi:UDP-N-acetylglucosamine 2-epimerase (non-hydrolysing)
MISNNVRISVILGARPNFVKAAAFFKEAKNHPNFKFVIIHTGQHFNKGMSEIFFDEMGIPKPDINLEPKEGLHTEKIGKIFSELRELFGKEKFDAVIVFGDVNSTLAGGIASAKNGTTLIHIESGLRSHDRRMPEEINRVIVDHLSDLLFTTEPSANDNLVKEGINKDKIKYVGNILTENIDIFWEKINSSDILSKVNVERKKYILATFHRQENIDSVEKIKCIIDILNEINKNIVVVLPLHPGTKKKLIEYGLGDSLNNLKIIEPLGYFEFLKLINESHGVITDSGGIQEETSYLGIPCATIRDNTERPITIEKGSNKLFSIDLNEVSEILKHLHTTNFKPKNIPLWDKDVTKRIFIELNKFFADHGK